MLKKHPASGYIAIMVAAACIVIGCLVAVIDALIPKTVYADIVIKDYGTITVKLEPDHAPITVKNFVKLAESGFYDGLTFHRIKAGFMMQGGDPNGNGTGSSDPIKGEFISNGVENPLKHTAGAISMARRNDPDSGSCQFFIVHKDSHNLDGDYAVFGYVVEGMDIVDKICTTVIPTLSNYGVEKENQPIIETIIIRRV